MHKITIQDYDQTVSWEVADDEFDDGITIRDLVIAFKGLLLSVGYQPESINEYIK